MPRGHLRRMAIALVIATVTVALCASCSVSLRYGNGDPQAEQAYREAVARPMNVLTIAARNANETCAGGSRPSPAECYTFTKIEITAARALERAMRDVPTPTRFVKANTDLMHGLDIFIQGLIRRDEGLAAHSTAQYIAGSQMVGQGLDIQRIAISEYPKDAKISL
jgi:hypothetical protein